MGMCGPTALTYSKSLLYLPSPFPPADGDLLMSVGNSVVWICGLSLSGLRNGLWVNFMLITKRSCSKKYSNAKDDPHFGILIKACLFPDSIFCIDGIKINLTPFPSPSVSPSLSVRFLMPQFSEAVAWSVSHLDHIVIRPFPPTPVCILPIFTLKLESKNPFGKHHNHYVNNALHCTYMLILGTACIRVTSFSVFVPYMGLGGISPTDTWYKLICWIKYKNEF